MDRNFIHIQGYSDYTDPWTVEILDTPGIPILLKPENNSTASNPVTFEWMDSGLSGLVDGYIFKMNGTTVITFTTPTTNMEAIIAPGSHSWSVASINAGGASDFTPEWQFDVWYMNFIPMLVNP